MKRVPYGISDFPSLIREGFYNVCKTRYIERDCPHIYLMIDEYDNFTKHNPIGHQAWERQ